MGVVTQILSPAAAPTPAPASAENIRHLKLSNEEKGVKERLRSHPCDLTKGLPIVDDWPQYPLLVTQSERPLEKKASLAPELDDTKPGSSGAPKMVCVNSSEPIKVDTGLFEGETFIFVQKIETKGIDEDTLGELQKRRSSFTLKGTFRKRVRCSDLLIGHEFKDGVISPPNWQRAIILGFLNKLFPYLQINLGECASALAPVMVDCKRLTVSKRHSDGRSSPLALHDVQEETALLGGYFAEKPRSPRERMRFFKSKKNLESFWFEPDLEYTFEFYQSNLSFIDYKLYFGFINVGIGKIIKGKPVQFLIKNTATSEYLCYFQFWSANLLKFVKE